MAPAPDPRPLSPILIIGIGSPFGDDAAGLEAARRLESAALPATRVIAADRPGVDLVDMLDGTGVVILIDAVRSGSRPGKIHDLDLLSLASLAAQSRKSNAKSRSQKSSGRNENLNPCSSKIPPLAFTLVSSHGLGVGEAIDLARRLGRLPARGRLLGIEVPDPGKAVERPLSPVISAAVDRVVQRAVKWTARFATAIASSPGTGPSR